MRRCEGLAGDLECPPQEPGFTRGRGHPGVSWHPERKTKTLQHGDDYVSAGNEESLKWLEAELSKAYELQSQARGVGKGSQTEGKVLNRIIRCTSDGREIEADRSMPSLW